MIECIFTPAVQYVNNSLKIPPKKRSYLIMVRSILCLYSTIFLLRSYKKGAPEKAQNAPDYTIALKKFQGEHAPGPP